MILLAVGLVAGCAGSITRAQESPSLRGMLNSARTPDYKIPVSKVAQAASPASVAAEFYAAWQDVDARTDTPRTFVVRCAALVTPGLLRQLAADQPPTAAWRSMQQDRSVITVRVRAVIQQQGAPRTPGVMYLCVYATELTASASRHFAASSGITLQLTRVDRRWLVSQVLFY